MTITEKFEQLPADEKILIEKFVDLLLKKQKPRKKEKRSHTDSTAPQE